VRGPISGEVMAGCDWANPMASWMSVSPASAASFASSSTALSLRWLYGLARSKRSGSRPAREEACWPVSLGQANEYTALAVIEEAVWIASNINLLEDYELLSMEHRAGEWVLPSSMTPGNALRATHMNREYGRPPYPPMHLRHLVRYEAGLRYFEIVDRVKNLMHRLMVRPGREPAAHKYTYRAALLADATGVGRAIVDSFNERDVWPIPVTIHGGSAVMVDPGYDSEVPYDRVNRKQVAYRVPKKDLVSAVQVLLQTDRLKFASGLPLLDVLKRELMTFRMKHDPSTAHESFEHWRERDHDDLVLAVALACWFREYKMGSLERAFVA
jgi:hypothetical protein